MNQALDSFFHTLHSCVILVNCFGWILPATRKLQWFTLAATLLSWLVGGWFFGWGYCFLTDWHWQVKQKLGQENLPHSYPQLLLDKLELGIPPPVTDALTVGFLVFGVAGAIFSYVRSRK